MKIVRAVRGKAGWLASAVAAAVFLALSAVAAVPAATAAAPLPAAGARPVLAVAQTKAVKAGGLDQSVSSAPCVFGPDEVWNCTSSDPTLSIEWTNFGDTSGCLFSYTYTWGDGSSTSGENEGGPIGSYVFGVHTYQSPGTYTITNSVSVVSGNCTVVTGTGQFTYAAHYELDLKLWIPQQTVVDPANPTGDIRYPFWSELVSLGFEPDLSNPSPAIGPFETGSTCEDPTTFLSKAVTTVDSFFDGDGYVGYDDGSTYRAAATVSFDWDGSNVSDIVFTPYIGVSHRLIIEKTSVNGHSVTLGCVEEHPGTATISATSQGPSRIFINMTGVVGFLTDQAVETGAYPSNTWKVQVNPDGSLSISYAATEFPTTGLQVLINGQVQATDVVNDASCYTAAETRGPLAVANFPRLFHTMTRGSLPDISLDGQPSNIDTRSPGCLF
jgi:hypothetical protein